MTDKFYWRVIVRRNNDVHIRAATNPTGLSIERDLDLGIVDDTGTNLGVMLEQPKDNKDISGLSRIAESNELRISQSDGSH